MEDWIITIKEDMGTDNTFGETNFNPNSPAEGASNKFRDVLNEVQRLIEINDGATGGELRAIWNNLSFAITESERRPQPTAEGAKAILLKHCKENKVFLTSNELHTILDAMREFAAQQQPPAEGAEEIFNKYQADAPMKTRFINFNEAIKAMQEFATLHAQRIAEKMVEERTREELMGFRSYFNNLGLKDNILIRDIDEYLKSREP